MDLRTTYVLIRVQHARFNKYICMYSFSTGHLVYVMYVLIFYGPSGVVNSLQNRLLTSYITHSLSITQ